MTASPTRMTSATYRSMVENTANAGKRSYPAKRQRIEDKLQIDAVAYLRLVLDPKSYRVAAIRNEGKRSVAEGVLAKAMGMLPGIPDLVIIGPLGASYFIELKTEAGKLTSEQDDMRLWMVGNGVPYAICRSLTDIRTAINSWNIQTREA